MSYERIMFAPGWQPNIFASTRLYDPNDPDGSKAHLRWVLMPRVTPWPDFEPFPRYAACARFVADWRERFNNAWQALARPADDDYWRD